MLIYNGNGVDVWKIAPNQAAQIGYQHPINAHCNCAMYHHQRRRRHHHQARQIKLELEFGIHGFLEYHVFLPIEQAGTNIC